MSLTFTGPHPFIMAKPPASSARRREVRKAVPKRPQAAVQVVRDRRVLWASLYALLLAATALAVNEWANGESRYYDLQVLESPIVAHVDFEYEDTVETALQRDRAKRNQLNVYVSNESFFNELRDKLQNLITNREETEISERVRNALARYIENNQPILQWEQDTRAFLRDVANLAILRPASYEREKSLATLQRIILIHPDPLDGTEPDRISTPLDFFSVEDTTTMEDNLRIAAHRFKNDALENVIVSLVMLDPQPTYTFSSTETEQRKQDAVAAIEPVTKTYKANTVLLPTGHEILPSDKDLIRREQLAYAAMQPTSSILLRLAGSFAMLLLITSGLWAYTFAYQPRITRNVMRGLAITLLILLAHVLAVVLSQLHPQLLYGLGTFPPLLAAIILAIVYDQRYALAVGVFTCILVAISMHADAGFVLVLWSGVGVAVAMLKDVRTRSKLVRVGMWSGLAMGFTTLAVALGTRSLMIEDAMIRIGWDAFYAVLAGLSTGMLVQGILPAIERAFKVTTAMTLRELNDASHPLLQRLAQEAAGTYQHSLRIADMSEAAAETIGADGLLCRVGAMYHDIGKVNKPLYFIENQGGGPNRHSKLSPAMSLLIIVGHVKDGIEMAREYNLPPELRHFIESHHGTTLVEYFYHAARKQKEAEEAQAPSEFEFRYPGPKPQTKEAAIMLLCDSIEAAGRVLSDPTPIRIEQLVDTFATKRLMDGQFDECNLTLQELHKIQLSLTKTLCAIYHTRIKYPSTEQPQSQSA